MIKKQKNSKFPSRYPSRASNDKILIREILDEGLFCTVAYVKDNKPYQIPTGFCRMDDNLFIHGSSESRFLQEVLEADAACVSVMIYDGLALAPTALNHSVNYRSVVIFSQPEEVEDESKKTSFFESFTNKYVPGRMAELQAPSPKELSATRVLSFDLSSATSKIRTGPVGVDTSKTEVWSGIVPASVAYGIPEPDKGMKKGIKIPKYLTEMVVKSNT